MAASFTLTLISKFSHDRPNMEFTRKGLSTIGFKGDYSLGLLVDNHVLIRFTIKKIIIVVECMELGVSVNI